MIATQTQALTPNGRLPLRGGSIQPCLPQDGEEAKTLARARFLEDYPDYQSTAAIDELRASEYGRLDTAETYVDYMGGSLFPAAVIVEHGKMLLKSGDLFGNAHSRSESSRRSSALAYESRLAVLNFFDADPEEYTVIFTPNATGALKMVGESFPYAGEDSSIVLPVDAHNSVHGLRVFAENHGARVSYYGCGERGGVDMDSLKTLLVPQNQKSLLVITGQSNVTGAKAPLQEIIPLAKEAGFHILLDAAALAPTGRFSLRDTPVDAAAVSFYKICGYPTGLGALIVRRTFCRNVMRRVWFAGGTVTAVQVPGSGPASYHFVAPPEETECPIAQSAFEQDDSHAPSDVDAEKWEDGTLNYLGIPAVRMGLEIVARYRHLLPQRLTILGTYLAQGLMKLTHANGAPIVHIVSTLPDVARPGASGALVSCIFLNSTGKPIRNDVVEKSARASRVALRTGCLCNPFSVFGLLHQSGRFPTRETEEGPVDLDWWMKNMHLGLRGKDEIAELLFDGDPSFGLVRISLGLASNFDDVYHVLRWAEYAVPAL